MSRRGITGGVGLNSHESSGAWSSLAVLTYPEGNLDTVRWLVAEGGSSICESSYLGDGSYTALILAAATSRLETVQ
jgi:hypothetical protein